MVILCYQKLVTLFVQFFVSFFFFFIWFIITTILLCNCIFLCALTSFLFPPYCYFAFSASFLILHLSDSSLSSFICLFISKIFMLIITRNNLHLLPSWYIFYTYTVTSLDISSFGNLQILLLGSSLYIKIVIKQYAWYEDEQMEGTIWFSCNHWSSKDSTQDPLETITWSYQVLLLQ